MDILFSFSDKLPNKGNSKNILEGFVGGSIVFISAFLHLHFSNFKKIKGKMIAGFRIWDFENSDRFPD